MATIKMNKGLVKLNLTYGENSYTSVKVYEKQNSRYSLVDELPLSNNKEVSTLMLSNLILKYATNEHLSSVWTKLRAR